MADLKAQRAYGLQGKGDIEGAKKLYEEAMAGGLSQPRFLLAYTLLLIRGGEYEKAKGILIKAQKLPMTPDQKTQLFINYAACVYKLGEIDKGISLLKRQHQHQPSGLIYQTLGYLLVEKYDASRTPDFAAQAEKLAAQAAEAPVQPVEAAEDGEEAPQAEPAVPPTAEELEQQWQAGMDETEAFLREAVDYDDEDAICLDNLAQFLYRVKNDPEAAREWFDKALHYKEGQIDTLWFLSRYDVAAGDTAKARERLEKALEGRFSPLNYADKATIEAELKRLGA